MDTLKNFDNKVGKDCEKNGLCTCTRKEKIWQITMEVWDAVEWTGLARMKAVVSLRLLSTLLCEMRRLETVKSKGEI